MPRPSPIQLQRLGRYRDLLIEWNARTNLTSIEPDSIVRELIQPALDLVPLVPEGSGAAVDVGSGGGVPGIPLAIATRLQLTLIESERMKCAFLEHVAAQLGLDNVEVDCRRAEVVGQDPGSRERFDLGLARAVAALPTLLELVLPLVRVGGVALLPKGDKAEEELRGSGRALEILGGEAELADGRVVVVRKKRRTPPAYPRRPGIPQRRPL